jgi:hypothetical protein
VELVLHFIKRFTSCANIWLGTIFATCLTSLTSITCGFGYFHTVIVACSARLRARTESACITIGCTRMALVCSSYSVEKITLDLSKCRLARSARRETGGVSACIAIGDACIALLCIQDITSITRSAIGRRGACRASGRACGASFVE